MGSRINPSDIAAAAGFDMGVTVPGGLDDLSSDPSLQPVDGVVAGENGLTTSLNGTSDGDPVIGGSRDGAVVDPGARPEFRNSVIAQSSIKAMKDGDLEGSLSALSQISDGRVADLVLPEIESSVVQSIESILAQTNTDDLVSVDAFEKARAKLSTVPVQQVKEKVMGVIDRAESTAILASDLSINIKAVLALRLSTSEARRECVTSICTSLLSDSDPRRHNSTPKVKDICQVLSALGMNQAYVNSIKDRLTKWNVYESKQEYSVAQIRDEISNYIKDPAIMDRQL